MNHEKLSVFTTDTTPAYGITIAGAGGLLDKSIDGFLPLAKGLNVSTFRINPNVKNWVDLNSVRSKSIWGITIPKNAYAVSIICHAPQCASFDPTEIAFNDSTIIFIPKAEYSDFPWDILINSSIVRFIYLLVLRTALVGVGTSIGNDRRASWAHIYPRTLETLPVPKEIFDKTEKLMKIRNQLSKFAQAIATRWEKVKENIEKSPKKRLALYNIDFMNWNSDIEEKVDYHLTEEQGIWKLRPFVEDQSTLLQLQGSYELLNVVKYLLENLSDEGLTVRELQNLMVPENTESISALIDTACNPNSSDIQEFKKVFKEMDNIIASAFGLNKDQWTYIQDRLSTPPFDVLEPRWPWKAAEMRVIQEYEADRFA